MSGISAARGTHDVLTDEADAWEWILATHARVAAAHGYRAVDLPIFEPTEMFERGTGAGTDVVEKEMYTFTDRGGRSLTLRPEATPSVVRAVLSAHLDQATRPVRVRLAGPMFRYDRPQAGRQRQFTQLDIECIGERSPFLDVEVAEVGWRFYEALGITGIELAVNTLGDLDDRQRYRAALVEYYNPLSERLCSDCRRRLTINPLRLLDCKTDAALGEDAPVLTAHLSADSTRYFEQVQEGLTNAGISYRVVPRLVRGLDYYAHTTFEYWHTSLQGAQNALGGGGRYDGLAEVLGFPSTPGVGYGLGVERALMVATDIGVVPSPSAPADAVVCAMSAAQGGCAAELARQCRASGLRIILDISDRRMDRRLRALDRMKVGMAVIVGADEEAAGSAAVRRLRTREQVVVPRADVAATIAAILESSHDH